MAPSHREKVTPPPSPSPLKRMNSPFIPKSSHPVSARPPSQPPQSRLSLRTRTKFRLLILTLLTLTCIFILNEARCLEHGCMGSRKIGEGGKVERIGGGSVLPVGWRGGSGDDAKGTAEAQKIMDGGAEGAKTGAGVGAGVGDDLGVEGAEKTTIGDIIKSANLGGGMVPQPGGEKKKGSGEGEWMGGQGEAAYDDGPASTSSPSSPPSALTDNDAHTTADGKHSTSSMAVSKSTPSPSPKKNTTSHHNPNTSTNLSIPKQKVQPNLRPPTHPHSLSKSPLDHAVYTGLQDSGDDNEEDNMVESVNEEEEENKEEEGKEENENDKKEDEEEHDTPSSSKPRLAPAPDSERGIETEGERNPKALALSVTSLVPAPAHAKEKPKMRLGSMDMGVFGGM